MVLPEAALEAELNLVGDDAQLVDQIRWQQHIHPVRVAGVALCDQVGLEVIDVLDEPKVFPLAELGDGFLVLRPAGRDCRTPRFG
jgi:hypothetical protein